jgi:hypothetical protein
MGGYGSGRFGARPTSEATQSFVLDMRALTRAGVRPGLHGKARIHFGEDDFPVDLEIGTRGPGDGHIRIAHETRSTREEPHPIRYSVYLTTTRPHFGGLRYWFICPADGRRVAKLYLLLGSRRFLSRRAFGLGYACQRVGRSDRLMRKARKLHRGLGGDGEALGQEAPDKPKGMHWRTYERKVAAWEAAEERADEARLVSAAPLLRRIGI